MKKLVPELQVVLPYSRLVELLEAAQAVDDLKQQHDYVLDQLGALRNQFVDLMEVVGDLKREVADL